MFTGASLVHEMDLDQDQGPEKPAASILWDRQDCVPLEKVLSDDDVVLLLTPVVIPPEPENPDAGDPFEPLGQAISRRHNSVRHVPYTKSQGITGVHVAFIRRAKIAIFVITGFTDDDGGSQPELADMVAEVCETRPLIILACCGIPDGALHGFDFATLIQAPGFTEPNLGAVASLLLDGEQAAQSRSSPSRSLDAAPVWRVEPWDMERDIAGTHTLWIQVLPRQFHLNRLALASLLDQDGYAMHHVVRDANGGMVGFCATYTTFAYRSNDRLVGSIAAILVREDVQGRGVGRILHDEALGKMQKLRGVNPVQLGSTFPRLLYGVPVQSSCRVWAQKRGWCLDESGPGKGRIVADWIVRLPDMPSPNLASAGLSFRPCEITDVKEVLDMISRESERKLAFGWYDQYAKVTDGAYLGDIILGFEGRTLVATAITYVPNSASPTAKDLPWACCIGPDVGGVTCICIKDDDPEMVNRRDTVMVRMLHACCRSLGEKKMAGVFVDGVKSGERGFESLGFRKWAEYREIWRAP